MFQLLYLFNRLANCPQSLILFPQQEITPLAVSKDSNSDSLQLFKGKKSISVRHSIYFSDDIINFH